MPRWDQHQPHPQELPTRDPLGWDGVREPQLGPALAARVQLVAHEHTCPDGTPVRCLSQWISLARATLDRWEVGGHIIATSSRCEPPQAAPDFGWLDVIARYSRAA